MQIRSCLSLAAVFLLAPVPAWTAAPTRQHRWDLLKYTWVRLERRETGSEPNDHPARIEPATLRPLLESVQITGEEGLEPLFSKNEMDHINGPICAALGQALPEEDVLLFSTFQHSAGIFGPALTVTARIFVKDGQLQIIVKETRLDYATKALAEVDPPMPGYGSRTTPGKAVLRTDRARLVRPDWLAFHLEAAPAAVAAPAAAPAREMTPSEQRLRNLQRLREQNLITEEEFQKKRQEILKDL